MEDNLIKVQNVICTCIFKHLHISLTDFNTNYLPLLLERLNREATICFFNGRLQYECYENRQC